MTAITVTAETGEPFVVEHHGNKIRVSRKSEFNEFVHVMLFRRSEVVPVVNAMVDLVEAD